MPDGEGARHNLCHPPHPFQAHTYREDRPSSTHFPLFAKTQDINLPPTVPVLPSDR